MTKQKSFTPLEIFIKRGSEVKNKKFLTGFTLIELLVVIGLLMLFLSIIISGTNLFRGRARDVKRLAEINQIVRALEDYYITYSKYPGPTSVYGESEAPCNGWDTSTVDYDGDGKAFIEPLADERIFEKVPSDPIGTGTCSGFTFRYFLYSAGSFGCDVSRGDYYVLGINDLETSNGLHSDSPGWSCPSYDWQNEFEWVTGRFEK